MPESAFLSSLGSRLKAGTCQSINNINNLLSTFWKTILHCGKLKDSTNSILIFCSLSFETWKFRISLLPSPAASKAHHHLCPRWDKTSPWAWLLPSPGHVLKSSSNLTHYWDLSVLKQIQNIQNILIHSNNREQVKQQQANHAKTCWKQSEEFALRKITRISEFELLRTWLSLAVLHMKARSVSLD